MLNQNVFSEKEKREKVESVNGKEMMEQKCISQKMAKEELGKKRFKTHAYQIDIAIFSKC